MRDLDPDLESNLRQTLDNERYIGGLKLQHQMQNMFLFISTRQGVLDIVFNKTKTKVGRLVQEMTGEPWLFYTMPDQGFTADELSHILYNLQELNRFRKL